MDLSPVHTGDYSRFRRGQTIRQNYHRRRRAAPTSEQWEMGICPVARRASEKKLSFCPCCNFNTFTLK